MSEVDDEATEVVGAPMDDVDAEMVDAEMVDDAGDDDLDDDDVLLLEEVDTELVLQVWEPTGEPRVDAALDRLAELDPDDVHQHAAVFDDIHQQLRATLTDLDTSS